MNQKIDIMNENQQMSEFDVNERNARVTVSLVKLSGMP